MIPVDGKLTIDGLEAHTTVQQAAQIVGPLTQRRKVSDLVPVDRFYCKQNRQIRLYTERGHNIVREIHGDSFECNGEVLFRLGASRAEVEGYLGPPEWSTGGDSRKFNTYRKLGMKAQSISLMFDDGILTAIAFPWIETVIPGTTMIPANPLLS